MRSHGMNDGVKESPWEMANYRHVKGFLLSLAVQKIVDKKKTL